MEKIEKWELLDDNLILINDNITRFIREGIDGEKYIKYNNQCYTLKELDDIQNFNEYHKIK